MSERDWTFDQERNVACFTVRQVIENNAPILRVSHDEDDHSWQFLTGDRISTEDMMIVGMGEIVDRDSSLLTIGTMPPGYTATRVSVDDDWVIQKQG